MVQKNRGGLQISPFPKCSLVSLAFFHLLLHLATLIISTTTVSYLLSMEASYVHNMIPYNQSIKYVSLLNSLGPIRFFHVIIAYIVSRCNRY